MNRRIWTAIAVAVLAALWLAMLLFGAGDFDRTLLGTLYAAHRPVLLPVMTAVTQLGSWPVLLTATLVAAALLLWSGHRRSAVLLLGTSLGGRLLIEAQKIGINRLRPDDFDHLVPVRSLSFPSAHAGNSMLLFLSLALIVAPREARWWAVPAALAATFLVGISRPMLGVHWPSDVIGGWAFGAAWVLALVAIAERWPARAERRG
jgi:membrane-associated phospholipid phosphatase